VLRGSGLPLRFPVEGHIPVLVAARGPRMLELAGELADIVHIAPPFLGHDYVEGCIQHVRSGAARAGRSLDDLEIDLTLSAAVLPDAARARELAKTVTAYGIVWMTGVERYASARPGWEVPAELDVDPKLVQQLSAWDMWSGEPLPAGCAASIDEHVLRQFAVAGEPEECGPRLHGLLRDHPSLTGLRLKLPPLTGPDSFPTYMSMIEEVAGAARIFDAEPVPVTRSPREP
jgi:5,10-methylenetetrahydromethanopterin reductase